MPGLPAPALEEFARRLLQAAGMGADKAADVASVLVEGDLLGHATHGLRLLQSYLAEVRSGSMQVAGEPEVLSDQGAVALWDARRLPGPWVALRAIEAASAKARQFGIGAVSIRRSHHIAALAPYARRVADDGLLLLLMSSAPAGSTVAPFGGTEAVLSPSPIAAGFPAGGQPVMVDVSTSSTTNNKVAQFAAEGRRLEHPWLLDEAGEPTDDPAVLRAPRRGSVLPLGGRDNGHKGYGLALVVEAMTAGLAGHGRDDAPAPWTATLWVQVVDPGAFSGVASLDGKMGWIAQRCRESRPIDRASPVRTPGERGLQLRREQMEGGVRLAAPTRDALRHAAVELNVPWPFG